MSVISSFSSDSAASLALMANQSRTAASDNSSKTKDTENTSRSNNNSKTETDKGTLTMEDFFTLLAAQLRNQDMNSPMSNSEMMTQLTQMAMMNAIDTFSQTSVTTYSASLVGKKVSLAVYSETSQKVEEKVGTITSVDLFSGTPYFFLDNDYTTSYPISSLMSVHDAEAKLPDKDDEEKPVDPDKPVDPEKPDGSGGADGPNESGGTDGSGGSDGSNGSEST